MPGATILSCSAGSSAPVAGIIFSTVTPPGRSKTGIFDVRSIIVDSTPMGQGPPSSTKETVEPKNCATCSAVVGLRRPDGFALGAAMGRSSWSSKASAAG